MRVGFVIPRMTVGICDLLIGGTISTRCGFIPSKQNRNEPPKTNCRYNWCVARKRKRRTRVTITIGTGWGLHLLMADSVVIPPRSEQAIPREQSAKSARICLREIAGCGGDCLCLPRRNRRVILVLVTQTMNRFGCSIKVLLYFGPDVVCHITSQFQASDVVRLDMVAAHDS